MHRNHLPISRRSVLQAGLAATGAAFAARYAFAAPAATPSRFVFIILRGALDGMSAVPPYADPDYARLRGELAIAAPAGADEALALAHVRKLKGFYFHLATYCIVISFLAIVNLMTYHHYLWFLWSASGWGIGLLVHGLRVFDRVPFLNGDWERRQVEKYLGRELSRQTEGVSSTAPHDLAGRPGD